MNLKAKVERSPIYTSIVAIVLLGSLITGIGTVTGAYDAGHTSQEELDHSHPVKQVQIDEIKVQSICATLDIRIAMVEEQIYQMEISSINSPRLVEKKRDLIKMEQQYSSLNCASILQ